MPFGISMTERHAAESSACPVAVHVRGLPAVITRILNDAFSSQQVSLWLVLYLPVVRGVGAKFTSSHGAGCR